MGKIIYITGITGHVGNNILLKLLEDKEVLIVATIRTIDPFIEEFQKYKDRVTIVNSDITSFDECDKFLSVYEDSLNDRYLIHCAGKISIFKKPDPNVMDVNVNGTKNIVDAAIKRHIKRLVYVSSVDAIKKPAKPALIIEPSIYSEDKSLGGYGYSKAIASNYVINAQKSGLEVIIVNPSGIVGPNDYFGGPINSVIKRCLNEKLPGVVNGGYDIVDVRDVAQGIINALTMGKSGESYFLTGHYIAVPELMRKVSQIANKKRFKFIAPHWLIIIFSPIIECYVKLHHKKAMFTAFSMKTLYANCNFNKEKAIRDLGYSSRSIDETLNDTIKWMAENKWF